MTTTQKYPALRGKRREAFVAEAREVLGRPSTIIAVNDDARVEQLPGGAIWVEAWVMLREEVKGGDPTV